MTLPVIVLAAVSFIAVWAVYSYNFLVDARAKVREAMSGVRAQLKLRHDLVSSLCEVVRSYADHEHEATRAAAAQRSKAIGARRTGEIEVEENALAAEISHLLAVAEDYPRLKAAPKFLLLSDKLASIEGTIQTARELYNKKVDFYNSRVQRFPLLLVAMWLTPKSFGPLNLDSVEFDMGITHVGEFAA